MRGKAMHLLPPGGAVLADRSCIVPVTDVAVLVIRLETVQRLNSVASPIDLFRVMRLLGLIAERACQPRGGLRVRVKQFTITTMFGVNRSVGGASAKSALARILVQHQQQKALDEQGGTVRASRSAWYSTSTSTRSVAPPVDAQTAPRIHRGAGEVHHGL